MSELDLPRPPEWTHDAPAHPLALWDRPLLPEAVDYPTAAVGRAMRGR